jgi:HisJ family histidinol phosphate phosphatase
MARDNVSLPRFDLHVHTAYSGHSAPDATVPLMLASAAGAGMTKLAISEHVPTVVADVEEWRKLKGDRRVLEAVAADILRAQPRSDKPELLLGAEIDADPFALDGSLMLDDVSGIDYVLASSHLFPGGEAFWFENVTVVETARARIISEWVEWMTRVAANPAIDAIAHPGALIGARHLIEVFDERVVKLLSPMLESMAAHSTAFELNELLGRKLPAPARESYPGLVRHARALGVRFTLGSDAHGLAGVGRFPWIEAVAAEAELGPDDFIEPPDGANPARA